MTASLSSLRFFICVWHNQVTRVSRLFFCSWRYVNSALNSGWHNRKPLLLKNNFYSEQLLHFSRKTLHYWGCQFLQTRYKWYQWIPLHAIFLRLFTSLQNHQHIRSIESDLETIVLEERVATLGCSLPPSLFAVTLPKHQTTIHQYYVSSTHVHLRMCINSSGKITSKDKVSIQCKQPHRISSDHAIDTPLIFIMSHPNHSRFEFRLTV